ALSFLTLVLSRLRASGKRNDWARVLCVRGGIMAAGDPVFYRSSGAEAVVIFVHGFTGGGETWTGFPKLLRTDPMLAHYDLGFWEYPSTLDPTYLVTKFFWTNDPKIQTIGQGLRT